MKGLNINISSSCTSQDSTAILSSNMDPLPSSSSPPSSSSSSFSTFIGGGRAIDRHNPTITDERRSGNSSCTSTPLTTPCTINVLQQKPTTPISVITTPNNNSHSPKQKGNELASKLTKKKSTTSTKRINNNNNKNNSPVISENNVVINDSDYGRRSFSKTSDMIMKGTAACSNAKPGVDNITPPESSRYLLDDTSFLEVFTDFDPVLKLVNYDDSTNSSDKNTEVGNKSPPKPSSSSASSDQVVVLRVSLHCRGCERKMKKHLSRMAGKFNHLATNSYTIVSHI
ncbi:Protein SODIUM POTASSIUM ROOT DEFECTIVE 2 [Bienertia sinuspersici]